jgi:hypothetical protein
MFKHPHVSKYLNDNTIVSNLTPPTPIDTSMKVLLVSGMDKGKDNKIIRYTPGTYAKFEYNHGRPNIKKFGQSAIYGYNLLNINRNTTVFFLRPMPDDAAYAHGVLVAHYGVQTVSTSIPSTVEGEPDTVETHQEFQIMYTFESVAQNLANQQYGALTDEGVYSVASVAAAATSMSSVDALGWYTAPILSIRSAGHGKYGNNFSVRLRRDLPFEQLMGNKQFVMTVIDNDTITNISKSYNGAFISDDRIGNITLFEDTMLPAEEDNTSQVHVKNYEDNAVAIYEAYQAFLDTIDPSTITDYSELRRYQNSKAMTVDEFDLLFGKLFNSADDMYGFKNIFTPLASYDDPNTLDPRYVAAIDYSASAGLMLKGGTDGSFDALPAGKTFDDLYAEELVKAFSGVKDETIVDKTRVPYQFLFDANYRFAPDNDDQNVKLAMYKLNNVRCKNPADAPDAGCGSMFFLDTGTAYKDVTSTVSADHKYVTDPDYVFNANVELKQMFEAYSMFNNRNVSKQFQYYTTRNPLTTQRMTVTVTYWMTKSYIPHLQNMGIQQAWANKYSRIGDMIGESLYPTVGMLDYAVKDVLDEQRFNYFNYESDRGDVYRMDQNTSQVWNSTLTMENNMVILNYLVSAVEKRLRGHLFEFADATARRALKEELEEQYKDWAGDVVQSIEFDFAANELEVAHQIMHAYLAVKFRNLAKIIILEVDINPTDVTL